MQTVHLGLDYLCELVPPLKDDLPPARNKDDEHLHHQQTKAGTASTQQQNPQPRFSNKVNSSKI